MATLKVTNIKNESFAGDQLYLKTDGKIGIGTTSPTELLDVEGTIECLNELRSKTGNDLKLNAGSANRDVFLQVNDSTLMTVQGSTGNIGIGVTDPSPYYSPNLVVKPSASGGITIHTPSANTGYVMFADGSTGDDRYAGYIGFSHSTDTLIIRGCGNGTKGIDIESDGDLKINDGNLVVANGHGIDFDATADGSGSSINETLDDYERGSFSPTVVGTTTAGTVNYSQRGAYYIKIGRVVHCWVDLTISSASSMAGVFAISSLPFNKQFLDSQPSYYEGGSFWVVADTLSNSKPVVAGYIPNNSNSFYIYSADTMGSKTTLVLNTTGRVSCYIAYTAST